MNKIEILKKVLRNLWNSNKYKEEYIQFLIGGYDEEEFKKISMKYAKRFDEDVLPKEVKYIEEILNTKLEFDEISELFNTSKIFDISKG